MSPSGSHAKGFPKGSAARQEGQRVRGWTHPVALPRLGEGPEALPRTCLSSRGRGGVTVSKLPGDGLGHS